MYSPYQVRHSIRAGGCNDLLRRGAILTENGEDVLSQLAAQVRDAPPLPARLAPIPTTTDWHRAEPTHPIADDNGLDMVLERLGPTPVAVDELVRQCHLSAAAVATLLLELELAGRVERHPGNLVSLR